MAEKIAQRVSPRHSFAFNEVPTVRGSVWGGSIIRHYPDSYAGILDCVYEMADMIACSNDWDYNKSIDTVLKDEGWTLIPKHRQMILDRLSA